MPKVIEIPGMGNVEFPDSMSDEAIGAAIRNQIQRKPTPAQPTTAEDIKRQMSPLQLIPQSMADASQPFVDLAKRAGSGAVESLYQLDANPVGTVLGAAKGALTSPYYAAKALHQWYGGAKTGDPAQMAEGTSGFMEQIPNLAGLGAGGRLALARALTPDRLMSGAGSARATVANMEPGIPLSKGDLMVQAAKTGLRPFVKAGAWSAEKAAKALTRNDVAPPAGAPTAPPSANPVNFPNAPPPEIDPLVAAMKAKAGPPQPIEPTGLPGLEPGPFYGNQRAPAGPPNQIPFPNAPPPTLQGPQFEYRAPSGPGAEIPFPNAPLPNLRGPQFDYRPPVGPSTEIPFPNAPGVAGAVKPNIQQLREALAPSGMKAKQATIRLLPLEETGPLINEVPELAGLRKGPEFDQALVNGFRQKELGVSAAEEAVPRETTVPRQPIVDQLQTLQKEYAENPSFAASAAKLEKMIDKWKEMPEQIPWEQFRDAKRAFFKEASTKSAPIRKAYGVLMEASSNADATGNLAAANKSYSTVRRALDAGNFDIRSGERIGQVGKPAVLKGLAKVLAGAQP